MNRKTLTRKWIGLVIVAIALLSFSISLVMAATDLSGYVKNIEGTVGLQNVNVTIVNSSNGVLIGWELTDGSGFYNFTDPGSGTYNITFKKSGYLDEEVNNYVFTGGQTLNANLYKDGYGTYSVTVLDYQNDRPLENASVNISWGVGGSCPGPTCLVGSTDGNGKIIKEVPANQTGGPYYVHDFNAGATGYSDNDTVKSSVYEGNNVNVTIYLKGSCRVYGSVEDKYRAAGFENIQNAFVELLDKNNQTKLNFSEMHFYNTTSASNGFYEVYYPTTLAGTDSTCKAYVYSNVSDYKEFNELRASGVDYLLIGLEGLSKINGSVYDYYANTPVNGSNINISNSDNDVVYITSTDTGGLFSVWVNGSEAHKLKVSKDGYEYHINSTEYTGNIYYGRINITGKAWVFGYVSDSQNANIDLPNVSVNINDQGGEVTYSQKTDQNGYFSMNVSSVLTYDLNFSKTGYSTNTSFVNEVFSGSSPNDLGTVFLKGLTHVEGYVSDCENNLQLPGNKISQVSANLTADIGNSYEVSSNSGGYYSLWIPSTVTLYNITFEHADYSDKVISESQSHDVCMNGEVLLKGHVVDKYAVVLKKNLQDAVVSVYGPDNNKYYEDNTDSNGNSSIYIGYLSQYENYTVKVDKTGFYGYNNTILKSGGSETKILDPVELTGKTTVNVTVYDDFDLSPINNSEVRISLEEDGYMDYYYSGFTGINGNHFTNIRERSGSPNRYKVSVTKNGYSSVTLGPYSGDMNITTYLNASTVVNVRDPYAKPNFENMEGADVMLYYNFTTKANYSLTETVAYLNATCNLSSFTGLNVSMDCTDCEYPYYEWNSTDTGVNNGAAQFRKVHVGNYTLTVNGSDVGCGVYSWANEVNQSFAGTNFTITGLNVGVTKASVMVVMYNESIAGNSPISNALVSVLNKQDVNCTTASNGICVLDYVPSGGNVTVKAEHAYHNTNATNYTIQPANNSDYLNDFTSSPIFMTPYPGNLSVRVKNATNDYIQNVNVTALNYTSSLSQDTDGSGYANFTQLTGFYNVTADGGSEGYGIQQTSNFYV
ncbi:MAG: carboxypeptidase regulatory-like domain-containing protein, partial [Candidatus Aenigmatarchaeota archaeon]